MDTVVQSPTSAKVPATDMTGWATHPDEMKAVRDAYALLRQRQGGSK